MVLSIPWAIWTLLPWQLSPGAAGFVAGWDSVAEVHVQLTGAGQLRLEGQPCLESGLRCSPPKGGPSRPHLSWVPDSQVVLVRGPLARSPGPAREEGEVLHNANKGR